jgi:hypothetical protein
MIYSVCESQKTTACHKTILGFDQFKLLRSHQSNPLKITSSITTKGGRSTKNQCIAHLTFSLFIDGLIRNKPRIKLKRMYAVPCQILRFELGFPKLNPPLINRINMMIEISAASHPKGQKYDPEYISPLTPKIITRHLSIFKFIRFFRFTRITIPTRMNKQFFQR